MTEARDIGKKRLASLRYLLAGGALTLTNSEASDLLAHIAFQQAALDAATARAGELRDSVARLEGLCQAHHEVSREAEARAAAAEAENARLREALAELSPLFDGPMKIDWARKLIDEALAPAPGVSGRPKSPFESCVHPDCARWQNERGEWSCRAMADNACARHDEPPPAPAPEPSEGASDVVQWICALASIITREVTYDDVEPALKDQYAKALARALDAHRAGGGR